MNYEIWYAGIIWSEFKIKGIYNELKKHRAEVKRNKRQLIYIYTWNKYKMVSQNKNE